MRRMSGAAAVAAVVLVLSAAALLHGQEIFTVGPGVSAPAVVSQVRAEYTEAAKAQRIQGEVEVEAVVLADGSVGEVVVTDSLDTKYGLDQQAVNAIRQWTFKPGLKDGKPVAVRITIVARFSLT
jgi:periplasmic protein TonB